VTESQPSRRLEGRRAIVTGAAGGQGRAVCRRFLGEGARVMATDVEADALAALAAELAAGERLATAAADLRDGDAIAAVVAAAVESFGGVDALYNNASLRAAGRDSATADLDPGVWDLTFAVNARGTFLFCKHALPHLIASGHGVIVNVASVAGYRGDTECHAYSATKGALIALTASLAQTYGPQGVRAIALCPGFVATPMVASYVDDHELRDAVVGTTALRRIGAPEEIAAAAAFLVSDDAAFVTDVVVPVHGGLAK
jgi:NAD(P)-dependent dehydrogenase (short-subunit alcohol dehydrogenase family)